MSHLYWGNSSYKKHKESEYVARFMRKFNILPPEYGVHYEVFRHGLMHTHHPKWVKKGAKIIGWYISNTAKLNIFGVFIPEFTSQMKNAILKFVQEVKAEKTNGKKTRQEKFFEGFVRTSQILSRKDMSRYARTYFPKIPTI